MKHTINMLSSADLVKGHGVLSVYEEQVDLVKQNLDNKFNVIENKFKFTDIMHYHTIDLNHFVFLPFANMKGMTVGYVHFLPETLDKSLKISKIYRSFFYKYIIKFYKSMNYLVVVNPYFIDRLVEYGVEKNKIVYIPNFVCDKTFYPYNNQQKLKIKEKYKLDKNKFTIVCAGQLQTRKGIFDFIEVAKKLPDIQFVWAGGFSFGKMMDGYKEIQNIIDKPPSNVNFLGMVDRREMNDIYNLGDVMFLPSFDELFPMTILEAMNCKIPILLRDIDIYKNILFDYYQKECSVDGFVNIILKLNKDKNYYNKCCEDSWRGHNFYHKDNITNMWDEFYSKITNEKVKSSI